MKINAPNTSTLFTDQGDFQPPISNIKNFTLFPKPVFSYIELKDQLLCLVYLAYYTLDTFYVHN